MMDKNEARLEVARKEMVTHQLVARGIHDPCILRAMATIPRHLFVPERIRDAAYQDCPLPIGYDATISQPYIVAYMSELLSLSKNDRVFELGTGSGYQAAVLAFCAKEVISVERIPDLIPVALENLAAVGATNVRVLEGDATTLAADHAPYDAAILTAASPAIPEYLYPHMNDGGRIVVPVGDMYVQELFLITILQGKGKVEGRGGVRFVPVIGRHGFAERE
jgi:protein-L-isoaspartate(D-aspartate) O-methyltransferase